MKSVLAVLAGLIFGVLVASGVLAAIVFIGPDPVGLRHAVAICVAQLRPGQPVAIRRVEPVAIRRVGCALGVWRPTRVIRPPVRLGRRFVWCPGRFVWCPGRFVWCPDGSSGAPGG